MSKEAQMERTTLTDDSLVGDVVAAYPETAEVFERHQIDFCCGGRRTLRAAAADEEALGRLLEELDDRIGGRTQAPDAEADDGGAATGAAGGAETGPDWTTAPLAALVDHIVETFHGPLREELPRLQAMARKVHRVHVERHPALEELEEVLEHFADDVMSHMVAEEIVLFPRVVRLEAEGPRGREDDLPVDVPIAAMEQEHEAAGEALERMRSLTAGYTPPDDACGTFRRLYAGLEALERGMHLHIHLENNVLFPRALSLAGFDEPAR